MSDALRRLGTISIGDAALIVPAEVVHKPIEETPKALANDAPSADIARLEALKAEIRAARQVLHAEIGAVSPILGEIFRTWPEAVIVGTADAPPPVEQRTDSTRKAAIARSRRASRPRAAGPGSADPRHHHQRSGEGARLLSVPRDGRVNPQKGGLRRLWLRKRS